MSLNADLPPRCAVRRKREREHGLYTEMYDALLGELDDHPRKRPVTEKGRRFRERYVHRQANMIINAVGRAMCFSKLAAAIAK